MENKQYITTLIGHINTVLYSTMPSATDMDFDEVRDTSKTVQNCTADIVDVWGVLDTEKQDGTHIYHAVHFLTDIICFMAQKAREIQECIEKES